MNKSSDHVSITKHEATRLRAAVENLVLQAKPDWTQKAVSTTYHSTSAPQFIMLKRTYNLSDFIDENRTNTNDKTYSGIDINNYDNEPVLSQLGNIEIFKMIRRDEHETVIACDTEYFSEKESEKRIILSWQFAIKHNDKLMSFIFVPMVYVDTKPYYYRLDLEEAIGQILDDIGVGAVSNDRLRKYRVITKYKTNKDGSSTITQETYSTVDEALAHAKYWYEGPLPTSTPIGGDTTGFKDRPRKYLSSQETNTRVTILCHTGIADLTTFGNRNFLKKLTSVQGGLISLKPIPFDASCTIEGEREEYSHPILLSIRDTMCHAPAKKQSLKDLGDAIKINKIVLPDEYSKERMDELMYKDPALYLKYAERDSIVTLLYAAALYGYNAPIPVTITSAASNIMRKTISKFYHVKDNVAFNRLYRGVEKVNHGKQKKGKGYVDVTSIEPINARAAIVRSFTKYAYHGGYNTCTEVGFFPQLTFDADLQSAYPTAMCLCPDIDWDDPIKEIIYDRNLTLKDFEDEGMIDLFSVGYIKFEFPSDVKYPTIPYADPGGLIYPLSSKGLNGVYAMGPEIYLALKLGASVHADMLYRLNKRKKDDDNVCYSLREAVYKLVQERAKAKRIYGAGSLEELILKEMINAIYGKISQNVIEKNRWSAGTEEMESIGESSITNPVAAAYITSMVRAIILAASNEAHINEFMTCSATTDGMITNVPPDELEDFDLYGLADMVRQARLYLTDNTDASIWDIKHVQDDLVNFTTRGNVSVHNICTDDTKMSNPMIWNDKEYAGVCAHNSYRTGYPRETYEDRLALMTSVLRRTGKVETTHPDWPNLKDIVTKNIDFIPESPVKVKKSMDYDLKRKPIRSTVHTDNPEIDGVIYELAHFDTEAYETIDEYHRYRKVAESANVLRTVKDWELFFARVNTGSIGIEKHIRDLEWTKLTSVITGYRAGLWDIPALSDSKMTVKDKCAWINEHNKSNKEYCVSDWKNARRPERITKILPAEQLQDLFNEMGVIIKRHALEHNF